jgi:biotin synthase-like enzyme
MDRSVSKVVFCNSIPITWFVQIGATKNENSESVTTCHQLKLLADGRKIVISKIGV